MQQRASFLYERNNKANAYLTKEILDATQEKLLLKVYDFAIVNCQRGDLEKTNKAITQLINALNFDDEKAREISAGLYRLYEFAQDQMRKGKNEITLKILSDLREVWVIIFNKNMRS
ncbi:MAG: flagellar protein FliS [bacterium]